MKIKSWNVNGIRSVQKKGFEKWFSEVSADVVCLQEIKANPKQLDETLLHPSGYHAIWNPAEKPGYSGTVIYTKHEPTDVRIGLGNPEFDREGRVVTAEFMKPGLDLAVINAYFPNSQREHARLGFKLEFCVAMLHLCQDYVRRGKNVVLCGDFNIAHEEIDLRNPKTNHKNAGFLPEERAWMTQFLGAGFIDTFRHFEKGPDHYSWWGYRPGIRERNIGWRLDYHCVNTEMTDRLEIAKINAQIKGSDHCPVELTLKR